MSLDISKLPAYVKEASGEFLRKTVMEADTVKFVQSNGMLMVGIKDSENIHFIDGTVELQDGSDCGRTPIGSTSFDLGKVSVVPLKYNEDLCQKPLEKTYLSNMLRAGQASYDEAFFASDLLNLKTNLISIKNELILWKGDTSSTDPNLNKFDGFIKRYGSNTTVLPSGANLTERLQNALLTVPTHIKNADDFFILMSHEDLAILNIELARANYFREGEANKLFGTTSRIVPVKGLEGEDQFWFGRGRSYVVATDLIGDADKMELEYSFETKKLYLDAYWALGCQLVFKDELFVFTKA